MDTQHFTALIKQRLQQAEATSEQAEQGQAVVELDQSRVGRLSRMDAMQSQALNQAAQRRRDLEVQRLNTALKRIEQGEFGLCHECDQVISEGRLNLDPAALYCIDCASARE